MKFILASYTYTKYHYVISVPGNTHITPKHEFLHHVTPHLTLMCMWCFQCNASLSVCTITCKSLFVFCLASLI